MDGTPTITTDIARISPSANGAGASTSHAKQVGAFLRLKGEMFECFAEALSGEHPFPHLQVVAQEVVVGKVPVPPGDLVAPAGGAEAPALGSRSGIGSVSCLGRAQ